MNGNEFNEYYIKAEEWPGQKDEAPAKDEQPAEDESATLQESNLAERDTRSKNKTEQAKKSRRRREKMLNKSTGLLAGTVAVTVVAATLSANICPICHQENCSWWDDRNQQETTYVCPICSVENCELWDDINQKEITRIELEGDNYTILSGSEYQLGIQPVPIESGLWREVENRTSAIRMKDGSRAYIHYVPDNYIGYTMVGNTSDDNRECLTPATEMVTREVDLFSDLYAEGDKHVTKVELIYMPDGTKPQEENLVYEVNDKNVTDLPYVYAKTVPNTENLWLRISTTEKNLDIESLWKDTDVKVLDADVRKLELGSSMIFEEDTKHACTWRVEYMRNHSAGWGANYRLYRSFEKMEYDFVRAGEQINNLYMFYIEIANVEYEDVFDSWQESNKLAKKRGHNVWIPVYQLEDYTCNDITYQIYFVDKNSELNSTIELYCVPKQEKSVAVRIPVYDSEEKISEVKEGLQLQNALVTGDFEQVVQVLDNIYRK